jgi:hypothetical protein
MRRTLYRPSFTLAALIALATAVPLAHAQAPAFKLLYADAFALKTTLKVMLDFGTGVRHPFVVDTGSVGIVVPQSELPASVQNAADGSIRYTSSGLVVQGFWTQPIDIRLDVSGAIAHVSVFAATSSTCVQPATNVCTPGSLPHMMGIGFGRPEQYASPDRNPLIHIANLPAGSPANYRITHTGIELGLRNPQAIFGMRTIQLKRFTRHGLKGQLVTDYRTPTGTLSINGGPPQNLSILIDTGIPDVLIAVDPGEPAGCIPLPPAPDANCTVTEQTTFTLNMVDGAQKLYFLLGESQPVTTPTGHWIHLNPRQGNFINTGIHALARFNVFYDYTNGLYGLDPVPGRSLH